MNRTNLVATMLACVAAVGAAHVIEAQASPRHVAATDSVAVVRTVERFHAALAAGDSASATAVSEGAELMVLTRAGDAWRIAAIHWSSHRRR